MAELNLDKKLAEQACEAVTSILNGDAMECIVTAYQTSKGIGEDNPLVEHVADTFKSFQTFFNDELVPITNKIHTNMEAFGDLAEYFNKLTFAKATAGDVGTVEDNNYDAAKDL